MEHPLSNTYVARLASEAPPLPDAARDAILSAYAGFPERDRDAA